MTKSASTSYRWFVLGCNWLIIFFIYVLMMSVPPILELIRQDLHLSFTEAGLLLSVPLMMIVLFSIPGGLLADSIGLRRMVGLAMTLACAGGILRGASANFLMLFASTLLFGLGFAFCFPNLPKVVKAWFPYEMAGTATGIYTTGVVVGAATGLALTKPLLSRFIGGWREGFYTWGVLSLSALLLWWVLVREPPSIQVEKQAPPYKDGGFSLILQQRCVWLAGLLLLLLNAVFYGLIGWFPTYLTMRGISSVMAGFITSTISLSEAVGIFFIPFASDKVGVRKPFFSILFFVLAVASLALQYIPFQAIWILTPILGIFLGGTFSLLLTLPVEMAEPRFVGTFSGVMLSIGYVGGVIGPIMVAFLKDVTGVFTYSFIAFAIISLIAMVITFMLPKASSKYKSSS